MLSMSTILTGDDGTILSSKNISLGDPSIALFTTKDFLKLKHLDFDMTTAVSSAYFAVSQAKTSETTLQPKPLESSPSLVLIATDLQLICAW